MWTMAKRGYKLQEFAAHSAGINCLNIGKKACRLFITGGDDKTVNLWSIGKPSSLMSLCGHTSPVESVAFDADEILVLAGASNGAMKLWDLEEAKMVRTLTGHRSNCTAVEFHPFGEFFASGSVDTNLKIWDIRKKGCIHTYKGHTQGITTIRFSPDGRWVVSGGFDNAVKVWDLTAGKLLHDFKCHEGHIRSIDFHPLEFLLATGSADRTVNFWDLETFELIGSARPEATGVRAVAFHPDGRTIFSGYDESLRVYSWEPVICHDAVDIGWSTLGDLCIHDGKLLGCSYYRNSVGVWVADISAIQPYGAGSVPEQMDQTMEKSSPQRKDTPPLEKLESGRNAPGLRSKSPDYDMKEIKNIYVDTTGGKPVKSPVAGTLSSPKVVLPLDSKESRTASNEKHSPVAKLQTKSGEQTADKSLVVPVVVPRDSPDGKDSSNSGRESVTFSRTKRGMLLRPAHARKPSNSKADLEILPAAVESATLSSTISDSKGLTDPDFKSRLLSEQGAKESSDVKTSGIGSATSKFDVFSLQMPSDHGNGNETVDCNKETQTVKFVNGVAVVQGRTRTLVERFERREDSKKVEVQPANNTLSGTSERKEDTKKVEVPCNTTPGGRSEKGEDINKVEVQPANVILAGRSKRRDDAKSVEVQPANAILTGRFERKEDAKSAEAQPANTILTGRFERSDDAKSVEVQPINVAVAGRSERKEELKKAELQPAYTTLGGRFDRRKVEVQPTNSTLGGRFERRKELKKAEVQPTNITLAGRFERTEEIKDVEAQLASTTLSGRFRRREEIRKIEQQSTDMSPYVPETDRTTILQVAQEGEPQNFGRDLTPANDRDITEDLMQSHDVFLSTLRSRLTKLQVVRHFWERNDMKGAINAMTKLPDHSVQADVVSVLAEKMDILTLDLFSCLLPVLVGLLDSKTERHASVSLEILLKLVAVFGPVIYLTISAPRVVGVDLHAEQRLKCCNQCFIQLQKIQKTLPSLVRRGGVLARSAQELNLVLQQS